MKKIMFCLVIIVPSLFADMHSSWSYGKAVATAQEGLWTDAQKQMNQLLVNAPDQPDLLYDNGVAAYRLGQFQKAAAYFKEVTTLSDVPEDLKKQAHFNLGNSNVALNQLSEAIKQYKEVLAIDAENEPAKHNLAKVQEMLRQQQQQQKNKKQNTSENNDQQKNEQQKQEQSGNDSENQNQPQDNREDKNGQSQDQPDESLNPESSQKNKQQQSMNRNQSEKNETNEQQKGDQESNTDKKTNQQNRNNKQNKFNNSHTSASDYQKDEQDHKQPSKNGSQGTRNERKEQAMQTGTEKNEQVDVKQEEMHSLEQQLAPNEKWMARALMHQAMADEKAQKAVIKANVNKQLAGYNGQNCW